MKLKTLIPFAALFTVAVSGICQASETEWNRAIEHAPFTDQKDSSHSSCSQMALTLRTAYLPIGPVLPAGEAAKPQETAWTARLPAETVPAPNSGAGVRVVRLSETKTEGNVKPYSAA